MTIFKQLILFFVLFGSFLIPINTAACPATNGFMKSIIFTNNTACNQHIKIHYRTSFFSTKHVRVKLASGASYTFTYRTDSTYDKWAKIHKHFYRKVQSGHQYFLTPDF